MTREISFTCNNCKEKFELNQIKYILSEPSIQDKHFCCMDCLLEWVAVLNDGMEDELNDE